MFLRAYRICSNEFIDNELKVIYDSFSKLGYPRFFLDQAHSAARSKFYSPPVVVNEDSRNNLLLVPYNPYLDDKRSLFKKVGIDLVFTYPNTIRKSLIRNNSNMVPVVSAPGIYSIPCGVCPKSYFGETGRTLEKRLSEHKRDFRFAKEYSACFIHSRDEGHNINWNEAKLIHKSSNSFERKMLESLLIRIKPNFNMSGGQWGLDELTSILVGQAFPQLLDSVPPPVT